MQDEFVNRIGMLRTSMGTLNEPARRAVWFEQPPLIFTTRVAEAAAALADLESFCVQYGADITGAAKDKKREEEELEQAAFTVGSALVEWFLAQNDEASGQQVNLPLSAWQRLRDQALVQKARLARDLAQGVVAGPQSAAAVAYGITAAAVTALTGEIADYDALLTAPQQKIAGRKASTRQFRTRFNAVEAKFESLDRLVVQFRTTEAGRDLIAALVTSRVIRDLGVGPAPTPVPPPPTPNP